MNDHLGSPSPPRERPIAKFIAYLALYLFLGYIFFTLYGLISK